MLDEFVLQSVLVRQGFGTTRVLTPVLLALSTILQEPVHFDASLPASLL